MTLDEAIKHCEDVVEDRAGCCEECTEEHRQLAEWLKDYYKRLLSAIEDIKAEIVDSSFISDIYNDMTEDEIVLLDKVLKIIDGLQAVASLKQV